MIHIPVLRGGRSYKSLETYILSDQKTSVPICEVSMANRGLIAKDLQLYTEHKKKLNDITIAESLQMCKSAAKYFANSLPRRKPLAGR